MVWLKYGYFVGVMEQFGEDSLNTSSHTDTSTGLGTVNLSNSFTDTSVYVL